MGKRCKVKIWTRALLILAIVVSAFVPIRANSAGPVGFKDTFSDSRPSITTAINTITWTQGASSAFASGETITFTWPSGFTFPADGTWATTDFAFNDGFAETVISVNGAPACTNATHNVGVTTTQASRIISISPCGALYTAQAAGGAVTFTVGSAAHITNATAGVYALTGVSTDDTTQTTEVVIVAGVTLSATIAESLTFTVGGLTPPAIGTCATSGGTYSLANSTATTMPFTASPAVTYDTFYDSCQSLTTGTNGSGGYNTTVQTASTFASGSDTIAKGTCDGGCSDTTTAAWATAAAHTGFAYCMKDSTGTAAATADGTGWAAAKQCGGGSQGFKTFPNANLSQTAQAIMAETAPIATSDLSYFSMRLTIPVNQAAGTYTATIIYICTPKF